MIDKKQIHSKIHKEREKYDKTRTLLSNEHSRRKKKLDLWEEKEIKRIMNEFNIAKNKILK